ncbi:MAG: hybrid sensor histidine kinase/response regulator, partial [Thermodesulfobacteriota bacterium]
LMGDWSSEAPPVSESIGAPLTSSFSGRTARTEHYLAFLDNSGRPVAVSFRGDPGVTFQEDALVSRGVTYDTYRDTVDVKGFPIGLALYSDFYDLTQARWTTFKTTIGVVLAVVIVVLFIANYLSKRTTKTLELLAEKSNVIATGDYKVKIDAASDITEIAEICTSFNAMTRAVEKAVSELEKANLRLQELDQLKSAFLSSVSHELRTPLTSVLGFAKLIGKDFRKNFLPLVEGDKKLGKRAQRIDDNLEIIIQEGERLTRLINDVLDLAKIESGRMDYRDEVHGVREIVEQAVQAATGQFAAKPAVALLAEIAEDLPKIKVDRDKLVQVIINLLNNAAKFTEEGQVKVAVTRAPGDWIEVSVTDTGPGIPPQDLEKVFDKFHQVRRDDTLSDKPKGTGLGLTICHQIITHYGGRIWVESVLGEGSSFKIRLPSVEAGMEPERPVVEEELPPVKEAAVAPEPEKPVVLVVSGDAAAQARLVRVWEKEGFRTVVAVSEQPARVVVEKTKPVLATVEYRQPGRDGKTPAERFKEDPVLGRLPLVISVISREVGVAGALGLDLNLPPQDSVMLETIHAMIRREEVQAGPCLAVKIKGARSPVPPPGMCGRTIKCPPSELPGLLESGFKGYVLVAPGAAGELDVVALAGRKGVQVVFVSEDKGKEGLDEHEGTSG